MFRSARKPLACIPGLVGLICLAGCGKSGPAADSPAAPVAHSGDAPAAGSAQGTTGPAPANSGNYILAHGAGSPSQLLLDNPDGLKKPGAGAH